MSKNGIIPGADAPGLNALEVTPSDTTEFQPPARGLWVGGSGDLEVVMAGEANVANTVVFASVPSGTWMPIQVRRVMAATSATDIVAVQ